MYTRNKTTRQKDKNMTKKEYEEVIESLTVQLEIALNALEKMKSKASLKACHDIVEYKENGTVPSSEKSKRKSGR